MDTVRLLQEVEAEISRLQQVAELLRGGSPKKRGRKPKSEVKGKGSRKPMSQEARDKIAAAQKSRWAKVRAKKEKKAA